MNKYKSGSGLKNLAKNKLAGHYGQAIGIMMLKEVIQFFIYMIIRSIIPTTTIAGFILYMIIYLAVSVVIGVFSLGYSRFFLNLACGMEHSYKDLFYGFKNQSEKALFLSMIFCLLQFICMLPYEILLSGYLYQYEIRWLVYTGIALLIGLVIYIPIFIMISQSFYLLLDFPDRSAKEALKLSIRIMKGRMGRYFYITVSFIPLMLLCFLSYGIGFLWLMPYMEMTYACFFLDLMNPARKE